MLISKPKHIVKVVLFLFLSTICVRIDAANCAERVYYSIQISSFKNLENANRQVNRFKQKGKTVFWKKVDIPGQGEYYRVYLGKYTHREDAFEYWKKLREDETVIYCAIHEFREVVEPSSILPKQPETVSFPRPIPKGERFVDNQDGTITDRQTNLMWIQNGWRLDFVAAATWWDAVKKCKQFRHAGYTNWRLPSIEEWRSLIDTTRQAPALVEPNPFENIITHMPYWSTTEFTYSKDHTCEKDCPFHSYTVMLYSGAITHQKKSERAFILPVRNIE